MDNLWFIYFVVTSWTVQCSRKNLIINYYKREAAFNLKAGLACNYLFREYFGRILKLRSRTASYASQYRIDFQLPISTIPSNVVINANNLITRSVALKCITAGRLTPVRRLQRTQLLKQNVLTERSMYFYIKSNNPRLIVS